MKPIEDRKNEKHFTANYEKAFLEGYKIEVKDMMIVDAKKLISSI